MDLATSTFETPVDISIPPDIGTTLSMDIMQVDQQAHRLYAADRSSGGVDVFDVSSATAKWLTTIPTAAAPNGLVIADDIHEVFVGLNNSTVVVIDVNPSSSNYDKAIATINTGGKHRADEMDYDPVDHKVYVANSDDGIVSVIDVKTNKIIKQFTGLGPGLEQPRYNSSDGMMYMTSSDQKLLFEFDPKTDTLVQKISVPDAPNGLAINPKADIGLLGSQPYLTIWNFKTQQATTISEAGHADEVWYDPVANLFFAACSGWSHGPVIAILDGTTGKFITNVPTYTGGHMVAYDNANHMIYTGNGTPFQAGLVGFKLPSEALKQSGGS